MKFNCHISSFLQRKLATLVLLSASVVAFAALGDGSKKDLRSSKNLLSARSTSVNFKTFTLRSGYHYRGSQVFSELPANNYIILDRAITLEKGNQTIILPMRRKVVLLDHLTFKPGSFR